MKVLDLTDRTCDLTKAIRPLQDLKEAYGCPHDVGWAANASESGWTNAEILMGMMMPEILGFDTAKE